VCGGLVKVSYTVWQGMGLGASSQEYFLGTGGVFGLFSALTGLCCAVLVCGFPRTRVCSAALCRAALCCAALRCTALSCAVLR
jgi:hypothetical protein